MSDVVLAPGVYWRLRYLQRDAEAREAEARLRVAAATARYHDALRACGLDPKTAYQWRDADATLVRGADTP